MALGCLHVPGLEVAPKADVTRCPYEGREKVGMESLSYGWPINSFYLNFSHSLFQNNYRCTRSFKNRPKRSCAPPFSQLLSVVTTHMCYQSQHVIWCNAGRRTPGFAWILPTFFLISHFNTCSSRFIFVCLCVSSMTFYPLCGFV